MSEPKVTVINYQWISIESSLEHAPSDRKHAIKFSHRSKVVREGQNSAKLAF